MTKKVQSTVKPQPVEIDEFSVWIAKNIQEVTVKDEEGKEHIEYEYELSQLSKDEYILGLHDTQELNKNQSELALAELEELQRVIDVLLGGEDNE